MAIAGAEETGLTRREMVIASGAALGAVALGGRAAKAAQRGGKRMGFRYCLNTSTIRGQKKPLVEEIEIAAKAGYTGIEPWIQEIDHYGRDGGRLKDLATRIRDRGLTVESAIGFFEWIVDDEGKRAKALEEARRNMEMVAQLGGKHLAAPAFGATDRNDIDLYKAGERYRALLELSDQFGVVPMVEVWGFSQTLRTLGSAAMVAVEAAHPKACILADVYHMYKGGSGFEGLRLLRGSALPVLHMNDYPANPPRATINDSDRVYPGDGIAPLTQILHDLRDIGFDGALSLELFNESYYKQDALEVVRTALRKTQEAVHKAGL